MATHASPEEPTSASLPGVVPLDLQYLSRQSWALGKRVVDETPPCSAWRHTGGSWALTAFEATDDTVLIRLRTPVGRTRFYGATRTEFRDALPGLAASPDWEERPDGR